MIEINEVIDGAEIAIVRTLLLEYQQALDIDLCFQGFAAELETLPGEYAPPGGRLLLASYDGEIAGCAALRPLQPLQSLQLDTGEMKRLYVRPPYRSAGVGRQLAAHVIAEARAAGYQRIFLDTLPTMEGAQRLYESLGFKQIAAYRHNPIAGTRFLGLEL